MVRNSRPGMSACWRMRQRMIVAVEILRVPFCNGASVFFCLYVSCGNLRRSARNSNKCNNTCKKKDIKTQQISMIAGGLAHPYLLLQRHLQISHIHIAHHITMAVFQTYLEFKKSRRGKLTQHGNYIATTTRSSAFIKTMPSVTASVYCPLLHQHLLFPF